MKSFKPSSMFLLVGVGLFATSIEPAPASTRSEDATRMVTLESYGVAELVPEGGEAMEAVHVRATITNTSLRPLVLDVSKARAELVKGITVAPRFVNADVPTLPLTIVARGEHQTVDFYFAVSTARDTNAFELTWPMNVPAGAAPHARFMRDTERVRLGADQHVSTGRAVSLWFDPQYAWSTYFHQPGTAKPRPPHFVTITRQPTWELPAANDDALGECGQW